MACTKLWFPTSPCCEAIPDPTFWGWYHIVKSCQDFEPLSSDGAHTAWDAVNSSCFTTYNNPSCTDASQVAILPFSGKWTASAGDWSRSLTDLSCVSGDSIAVCQNTQPSSGMGLGDALYMQTCSGCNQTDYAFHFSGSIQSGVTRVSLTQFSGSKAEAYLKTGVIGCVLPVSPGNSIRSQYGIFKVRFIVSIQGSSAGPFSFSSGDYVSDYQSALYFVPKPDICSVMHWTNEGNRIVYGTSTSTSFERAVLQNVLNENSTTESTIVAPFGNAQVTVDSSAATTRVAGAAETRWFMAIAPVIPICLAANPLADWPGLPAAYNFNTSFLTLRFSKRVASTAWRKVQFLDASDVPIKTFNLDP